MGFGVIGFLIGRRLWVSILEILLVVFFSQIPIVIKLILHIASLPNDQLSLALIKNEALRSYTLSDVFIFITGVVGSAMAFFLINYGILRRKPILSIYCVAAPLVIMFFSTPIFVSERINANPPNDFSVNFAIFMLVVTIVNWLVIVYEKNFDFEPDENAERTKLIELNAAINQLLEAVPKK